MTSNRVRVFADANVLFSASYQPDHVFLAFWRSSRTQMVTSLYAADEARRNVANLAQRERLELLLDQTEVMDTGDHREQNEIALPEKDAPIWRGALGAQARFLVTGDRRHFGLYFGRDFEVRYGVLTIIEPSALLRLLKVGGTELDRTIQ